MTIISRVVYIFLFVISTLWVMMNHPGVHKPVIFENQEFKVQQVAIENKTNTAPPATLQVSGGNSVAVRTEPKTYNISPESVTSSSDNWIFQQTQPKTKTNTVVVNSSLPKTTSTNVVVNQPKISNNKTVKVVQNQSPTTQVEQTVTSPKPQKTFAQIVEESQKDPNRDLSLDEIKTVVNALTGQSQSDVPPKTQPKQTQTQQKPIIAQQPASQQQKQLTESEEIIAWNIWRANFQNTVMKNSGEIPAPIGTAFLYSCVVDKYGNISNINVWSSNPNYTPMAKQYVKAAIVAMQRKPVLTFPKGTKRTTVVAEGSFIMSNVDRYATPNYYSDYERVRVQK